MSNDPIVILRTLVYQKQKIEERLIELAEDEEEAKWLLLQLDSTQKQIKNIEDWLES